MEQLTRLRIRMESIDNLREVVHMMRALSAVRMQQADESLAGAREYAEIIGSALADALALVAPEQRPMVAASRDRAGLLLFCSEHGFVGALNEVLIDHATATLAAGDSLFVVGSRGARAARERGLDPAWTLAMTSHRDGVPVVARQIAGELYRRAEREEIVRLDMMFARTGGAGRWNCERQSLLPLDLEAFPAIEPNVPPLHYLPAPRLVEQLVEEYFFAELTRAAMEALAGENTARVAAMNAAHDNIDRKLEEMKRQENQLRQEEITTELIDVVTGSEALLHPKI